MKIDLQYLSTRGLMDECTHLGNYSKPWDPDLVEMVVAR